jgi:hypothetical protein
MIHDSFEKWMNAVVVPQHTANPKDVRLDGEPVGSESSRRSAGKFRHSGKAWTVDEDTHYEGLLIAYTAINNGTTPDPFVEKPTRTGKRTCLVLDANLTEQSGNDNPKYLYIYSLPTKKMV